MKSILRWYHVLNVKCNEKDNGIPQLALHTLSCRLYLFGGGNLTYYDTTHAHHDLNDAMQKTMEVLSLLYIQEVWSFRVDVYRLGGTNFVRLLSLCLMTVIHRRAMEWHLSPDDIRFLTTKYNMAVDERLILL